MNYGRVLFILGSFLLLTGGFFVFPALVALLYGEHRALPAFLVPALGAAVAGKLLRLRYRRSSRALYRREGLLVVVGCWLVAVFAGAVPYLASGAIPSPVDAVFESMSGFTTTGSTILQDIESLSRGMLFWRSMTHWLGGMGIVLLFVAILPALGVGGRLLYEFEVPGLESDDLKPRIQATALALWKIYSGITILQTAALLLCGLSPYDAVVHTFGTVSTGGFSPYQDSIVHFRSPAVEIVVIAFMFISGVNFGLYHRARTHGFRALARNREFQVYSGVLLGLIAVFAIVLGARGEHESPARAVLEGAFQVVSIGTTTGYTTADFDRWPDFLRYILVLAMFIGGCSGSTSGGIKVLRFILLFKAIGAEFQRFVYPNRLRSVRLKNQLVGDEILRNVLVFFVLSIFIFAGSSLFMLAIGLDMESALSSVAATLFNIGPGLGTVGASCDFSGIPPSGKVLLTILMLLGRLELFTAVVLLTPGIYRD